MNEHDGILRTNKHLVTECGEGLNNDLCVSQRITLDAHCNTTKKEKPPVSLSLGILCCISFQSQVHTHGALTGGDFYASDYKRPLTSRLCHMLSSGPLSTLQDNREVVPGLGHDPEKRTADSPNLRQPPRTPRLALDRQTQSRGSATTTGVQTDVRFWVVQASRAKPPGPCEGTAARGGCVREGASFPSV